MPTTDRRSEKASALAFTTFDHPWSEPRTHGRFDPTCHFERSEKSFPMHMVKISQSLRSFEMTKVEIILFIIKKSSMA